MRLSTQLFIHVLGFSFNLSGAILMALTGHYSFVAACLVCMFLSYQRIYHVMEFLDACEAATGDSNEN